MGKKERKIEGDIMMDAVGSVRLGEMNASPHTSQRGKRSLP